MFEETKLDDWVSRHISEIIGFVLVVAIATLIYGIFTFGM